MNKSKQLREQVEASITGTFNYLVFDEKNNGKKNYCVHDDIDNCMDTIEEIRESVQNIVNEALKNQRKAILEEVIGEDEDNGEEVVSMDIDGDITLSYPTRGEVREINTRNKLRAYQRQKLSILEGKK